ncbi:class F sortase [Micromonosporaceae bacterium Da 78-11]
MLPLVTAAVAAFVAGSGYLALTDRAAPVASDLGRWAAQTATGTAGGVAPLEGSATGVRPPGDPFGNAAVAVQGAPARVRVKAIGVDAGLEQLHLAADGELTPPGGFEKAGWYAEGTAPGDVGPAVIAGHVDSKSGPAVFYRLRELTTGDRIEVMRGGTVVRFTVTRTAWYPKTKFPTDLVYGPTPDRQLRLITCGGVFDHGLRSYKDNFVVYAVAG